MKTLFLLTLIALSGCAQFPQIASRGADLADSELSAAEWGVCRAATVGAWLRRYGDDPTKAAGWKAICSDPITQTPAKP